MKLRIELIIEVADRGDTEEELSTLGDSGVETYVEDALLAGTTVGHKITILGTNRVELLAAGGEETSPEVTRLGTYLLDNYPLAICDGCSAVDVAITLLDEYHTESQRL